MPPHDRSARLHELSPYPVPVPEGLQTKSGTPSSTTALLGDGTWGTLPTGASLRPATVVVAASDSKHDGADYVCTGTDDDLTINTAIAEIDGAPKGGSILFLDGTYSLGHKIVSPARGAAPGYVLRGSGASKIQAQDPATFPDDCFLEIKNTGTNPQGADCVTLIQNLLFDQNNASGTDLQSTSAIKCAGTAVQGLVIEDCAFSNLQGHALNLRGAVIRVHRNFFGNCQAAGNFTPFGVDDGVVLIPTGGVFLLWVQDNDFANYGNSGLDVNVTESNVIITGNAFGYSGGVLLSELSHGPSNVVANNTELALKVRGGGAVNMELAVTGNSGERIALQGCWDVTISGNVISGPSNDVRTSDPDADDAHHIALTDCDHCQVVGNRLLSRHVPGHFIALSGTSNCVVHDNLIAGGSGATYDGVFLDADSNANSVQGNLIRPDDAMNGVTINSADCDDNLVTNNDLLGTWTGAAVNDSGTGTVAVQDRGVGDHLAFYRTGGADGGTGSFDFTADDVASKGSSIVVDDSPGWISDFGWAVPMVTENGSYSIVLKASGVSSGSASQAAILFYDATATPIASPFGAGLFPALGNPLSNVVALTVTSDAVSDTLLTPTLWLAAGTHIDCQGTDAPDAMALIIQRVR